MPANLVHQYAAEGFADNSQMVFTPFQSGWGGGDARLIELEVGAENVESAGAVFEFIRLPADTIVQRLWITADELDTDGVPALTLLVKSVEDGEAATTHLTADTIGQAGGTKEVTTSIPIVTKGKPYTLLVEVGAAAAEGAPGKIGLIVEFARTRGNGE